MTKDSIDYIDIAYPDTLNGYTYAQNNPINNIDVNGRDTIAADLISHLERVGNGAVVQVVNLEAKRETGINQVQVNHYALIQIVQNMGLIGTTENPTKGHGGDFIQMVERN